MATTTELPFDVIESTSIETMKAQQNSSFTYGITSNGKLMFSIGKVSGAISAAAQKVLQSEATPEEKLSKCSLTKVRFHSDNKELWICRTNGIQKVLGTL